MPRLGVFRPSLHGSIRLVFVFAGYHAAKTLHEQALHKIMRAPLRFFDMTPVGRIISRFSKDQDILDSLISEELNWLLYALDTSFPPWSKLPTFHTGHSSS